MSDELRAIASKLGPPTGASGRWPESQRNLIIGFTGTRKGLTKFQCAWLEYFLAHHHIFRFLHGDCIGADSEAHMIAYKLRIKIHLLPCDLREQRAFNEGATGTDPPRPPLARNHMIVQRSDIMIAMPSSENEELRSGTWATIRFARRIGKILHLVGPQRAFT